MAKFHSIKLCKTDKMDRCDWLKWRRKGIGSSDIGAVCGVNKYKGPLTVFAEKVYGYEQPADPQAEDRMETGLLMERVIAAKYEKHHPNDRFEKVHFLLQHPTCHWALANLDGIIRIDGGGIKVIEMKNVQERTFESWEGKIPPYYLAQVQHQLWVTGLQEAILAVMVGGVHQHHFDIKRDETVIARQAEAGAAFWSTVEAGTPPEASDADSTYLGKTYSYHKEDVPAAEIPFDQVMAFRAAAVKLELAEAEYEAQKNRIKQCLGWSSVGTVDGKKAFSYSTSKGRETIDTKALAAAYPEIAAQFTRTHEGSRVLRFVYKDK